MDKEHFNELLTILLQHLEHSQAQGVGRGGIISPEWMLASTIRWLAGGSIFATMDATEMARSTAYARIEEIINAINACRGLRVRFPKNTEEIQRTASAFRYRSSNSAMEKCLAAVDGLLIRRQKPTSKERVAPDRCFSGQKMAVGVNLQVNGRYWVAEEKHIFWCHTSYLLQMYGCRMCRAIFIVLTTIHCCCVDPSTAFITLQQYTQYRSTLLIGGNFEI